MTAFSAAETKEWAWHLIFTLLEFMLSSKKKKRETHSIAMSKFSENTKASLNTFYTSHFLCPITDLFADFLGWVWSQEKPCTGKHGSPWKGRKNYMQWNNPRSYKSHYDYWNYSSITPVKHNLKFSGNEGLPQIPLPQDTSAEHCCNTGRKKAHVISCY